MKREGDNPPEPANREQRAAWNGALASTWVGRADHFDRIVEAHHRHLMEQAGISPDDCVLDVGCGTGQTTRDAARLAPGGLALGVDLSAPMIELARQRADTEGLANARFVCGDAQVYRFAAARFDLALSRTGVMFFDDPVVAFANIGRALRPAGRLLLLVWRDAAQNEWFTSLTSAFAAGRNAPLPARGAPGMFSLAEPDIAWDVLCRAGFHDVDLEPLDAPMQFGADVEDAYDFVLAFMGGRLEGLDGTGRRRALADVRAALTDHSSDTGVVFGSAAWIVAATWPSRP